MRRIDAQNGFSLIEMIVAMTIVSILAASVMISVSAKSKRAVIAQADQFRRDLSHIQMLGMAWGVPLRLTISSTGYTVTCLSANSSTPCTSATSPNNVPKDPATGNNFSVSFTDGVTMAAAGAGSTATIVDFDTLGRPWDKSTSTTPATLISYNPARAFTLSGSGRSVTVYLRPITGFAEVSY